MSSIPRKATALATTFGIALLAFALLVIVLTAGGAQPAALAQPAAVEPGAVVNITVLHTNDFHGNLEPAGSNPGMARVSQVINDVKTAVGADNVALVDVGDSMQGSLLSNLFKGEATIDIYNFMGYKVGTFGNHEFDWGKTTLGDRTAQAAFPFVTANIVEKDAADCANAGWTPPPLANVRPWYTMTVGAPGNQATLGFIGVTTQETPIITIASATEGLCFKDPAASILHYYDAMKAAGAEAIIVLSHLGYPDGGYGYGVSVYGDQTLAKKLNDAGKPANLIIGGHSHTRLNAATIVGNTAVVQAYYAGREVGRADLAIDDATGQVTVTWQKIAVSTTGPEDPAVKAEIATWANDPWYQSEINRVVGFTAVTITRDYNGDSLMGAFVNDAIYGDLNSDATPDNDVDMVFNNAGGLRADVVTGGMNPYTLTHGILFNVLPFGNATIVGDMTGAQVLDLLNQSATLFKGALQVSGVTYKFYNYNNKQPGPQPWAWGAWDIMVKNRATGAWEPLELNKTYRIATNEFLAPAGQDGYVPFKYIKNTSYWGDMLDGVERYVAATYPKDAPYNGALDGRITRVGNDEAGDVVPVTLLHNNDSHGNLYKSRYVGFTQLATLINQERAKNASRTLLLNSGDQIQGDAMMYYFKTAPTGFAVDGTPLPVELQVHPMMAVMNAMTYTAWTLGNHEFNFGNEVFKSVIKQAEFPTLQANLLDDGRYGIVEVPVLPDTTVILPGGAGGDISVAVLGIGNHRVPNYELPSNIPGLTFTDPIETAKALAPGLKANNDVVVGLTHIGFTGNPKSVEVDTKVDTTLAAETTGIDAIIGGHSHTDPSKKTDASGDFLYLPAFVSNPDNDPVIINHAYRYNSYLGEIVLGLLPKAEGGYEVAARAGRYLPVTLTTPVDPRIRAIVDPYVAVLNAYTQTVIGATKIPIDTLKAYTEETNGANLQADASVWELAQHSINVDFHLSGAMSNRKVADAATPASPVTLNVQDMFTLMPYENSLVVLRMNGPQLKAVLERSYRNWFYYKYVPGFGGYSYYTTCMIDINKGGQISYRDQYPVLPNGSNVISLVVNGQKIDFNDANKYYMVSTVNYLAAGSCNFNDGGASLWPLDQIEHDTQYYVRDAVIRYIQAQADPIEPMVEGRLRWKQSPAEPTTVELPLKVDTWVNGGQVTTNFNGFAALIARTTGLDNVLLGFDRSLLPAGAEIVSAEMKVNMAGQSGAFGKSLTPANVGAFNPKTVTYVNAPLTYNPGAALPVPNAGGEIVFDVAAQVAAWDVAGAQAEDGMGNLAITSAGPPGRVILDSMETWQSKPATLKVVYWP